MYHTILVPLDGSAAGEHALPIARSLALRARATLHLVHVHTLHQIIYVDGVPVIDEALHSLAREHERAYLTATGEQVSQGTELSVRVANLDGPVVPTVLDHAATIGADLIVMTTHGRGGLARAWLGSVADDLIHQATAPLLVVRPPTVVADLTRAYSFQHLLIPLDGSPLAEQILAPALALGGLMDADYTLLSVVPQHPIAGLPAVSYLGAAERDAVERWQHVTQAYLEGLARRMEMDGRRVRTRLAIAQHPAAAILEEAKQQTIDLIALATHGRSGAARVLLGSVADKVVRGANIPVLLYRPGATAAPGN